MQKQQQQQTFDILSASSSVVIPRGFQNNGSWIKHAKFRQITGYDEQFLFDIENNKIDKTPNFVKTIALLERIVTFESHYENEIRMITDTITSTSTSTSNTPSTTTNNNDNTIIPSTITILKNITIGERNLLLLFFRKLLMGDKIQCFVSCTDCGKDMSFEISIDFLLQEKKFKPQVECTIRIDNITFKIRPITTADEETASLMQQNSSLLSTKVEHIIRNCIISSSPSIPSDYTLSDDFINIISSKLSEIDPLADIVFDLECPHCQYVFKSHFIVDDFVFQELYSRCAQFEGEVHWLAFNYHWSEEAILSLPINKRKRYVELINRTLNQDVGKMAD